jgi:RNA-directed DNA polymerase
VLDADIAKCFDRIDHKALLTKTATFPTMRRQVRTWLKAVYCDQGKLFPTIDGTPQGGVISPLLANIALHGMEERVMQYAETLKGSKAKNRSDLNLIRYADNFVSIHKDVNVVLKCKEIIADWLSNMGLELKPNKTKLTHTLEEIEGNVGFEFLGFHVQQHNVGNYRAASNGHFKLGFTTLITPSKVKVKTHLAKIADVIDAHKTTSQAALISKLNPIIKGWSNYYSTKVSKDTFSKADHLTWEKLRAWARTRGKGSINKDKYWRTVEDRNWCFSTEDGIELTQHKATPIIRHVKVKGVLPYLLC